MTSVMKTIEAQLRALHHPGDAATICGVHVKRQALRYVIGGCYAYDLSDAVGLITRCSTYVAPEVSA